MYKKPAIALSAVLLVAISCSIVFARPQKSPLTKMEVLALAAGGVFPESLVYDIDSRGITFTVDDNFNSLVTTAGADSRVIVALAKARHSSPSEPDGLSDQAFLQHLSYAGNLIHSGDTQAAARELSNSLSNPDAKSAAGFVISEILIRDRRFAEAAEIYLRILQDNPDFPEIHSKLSFASAESDNDEEGLREAKLALKQNPNDAVAHRSAGIVLRSARNYPAAKLEFEASIRCKPDYDLAYGSLGILLDEMRDYAGAVANYKKAITLNPKNVNATYNLALAYGELGDHVSAIQEYREAKRLDPSRLDVRQNLGSELIHADPSAAITEFQELVALAPDFPICHFCLGNAYYNVGRLSEAQKEFQTAADGDPAEAGPRRGLGLVLEAQKDYDGALVEYRKAQSLDRSSSIAYESAGRVLLLKKDFPGAIAEFKQAEQLNPSEWGPHSQHAQALEGLGDRAAAIAEYQEALSLAPKQLQPRLDLALAQEKSGNWIAALGNYRQAALDEEPLKPGTSSIRYDAQNKYQSAQDRFQTHITQLRSSGHAADASALEASWKSSKSVTNLDGEYHDAIQASMSAMQHGQFDVAETAAKRAIEIAEKIQPPDGRLPESVGQLANVYAWRQDLKKAGENFKRQLAVSEKIYGPQSPMLSGPLQNLGMWALQQNDFANAETWFNRSYELNQKTYGENSQGTADSLRGLAHVYQMQKDFPKAESATLRALKIYETVYGPESQQDAIPWTTLCALYDRWGKPEKSVPCHEHLVSLAEKLFGPDSAYLVQDLTGEAHALRQLGRNEEAAKLEQRAQSLQSSQSAQMPMPPASPR
jgi:tetratricopeptide (TPR) repeat protein